MMQFGDIGMALATDSPKIAEWAAMMSQGVAFQEALGNGSGRCGIAL